MVVYKLLVACKNLLCWHKHVENFKNVHVVDPYLNFISQECIHENSIFLGIFCQYLLAFINFNYETLAK